MVILYAATPPSRRPTLTSGRRKSGATRNATQATLRVLNASAGTQSSSGSANSSHAAAPHVSNSLRHSSVRDSNQRQSTQSRTPSASCPTTRTKRPAQRCAEPVSSSRDAGKSLIVRIFALSDSCRRVLIVFLVYEDVFLIRVDVTLLRHKHGTA